MEWDHDKTVNQIKKAEEERILFNCNLMYRHEFSDLEAKKFFVFRGHHDKVGRPILHILLRNLNLEGVEISQLKRFFCFILDDICSKMDSHVDSLIMIVDCKGFGRSNFWLNHFRAVMGFL